VSWLHVVVPGPLETPTGGFVYDRRMIEGLRGRGCDVRVHALPQGWPRPDTHAYEAAAAAFDSIPDGVAVLVDGLALGVLPELAAQHARRLHLVALVHHPLAAETGLSEAQRRTLARSERDALARVRHVVTTSAFTADAMLDYGVTAPHLSVIPPGVAPATRARGSGGSRLALLSVGAVIPRKGHDLLLNALVGLTHYPWRLDVVGSETLAPRHAAGVRRLANELGLHERVSFHGELDGAALAAAYNGADLFVLASHYEGYGMVLNEAVAHGLPVVATAGGAVPFTLAEGAGLLAPAGDVEGLRAALARVMHESDLRARLRRGAQHAAYGLPSWEDGVTRLIRTVEAVTP